MTTVFLYQPKIQTYEYNEETLYLVYFQCVQKKPIVILTHFQLSTLTWAYKYTQLYCLFSSPTTSEITNIFVVLFHNS